MTPKQVLKAAAKKIHALQKEHLARAQERKDAGFLVLAERHEERAALMDEAIQCLREVAVELNT